MHSAMMAQTALQQGQGLWVTVNGESMRPLLRSGDRILLEPVHAPRLGDLITFYETATLCTHRVIGRVNQAGQPYFLTKGDLCGQADQPVPIESIVGRVAMIQKGEKRVVLTGPAGRLLNLTLLVLSLGLGRILKVKWKLSQIMTSQ